MYFCCESFQAYDLFNFISFNNDSEFPHIVLCMLRLHTYVLMYGTAQFQLDNWTCVLVDSLEKFTRY